MTELKLATFNCQSLVEDGRLVELNRFLQIMILTFASFRKLYKSNHRSIMTNYSLFRSDRSRRGGRILIKVRRGVLAVAVPVQTLTALTSLEATVVVIDQQQGRKLFCLSVCNPDLRITT